MQIHAVAFDVDGTLYSNAVMYLRSLPFALGRARLLAAYRHVRREVRRMRPVADPRALEAELLASRLAIPVQEARRRIEDEILGRWEEVLDHVRPYRHVDECIAALRSRGLKLGVSSDFPVESKLARLGLSGRFDCALWSESSGYLKPNPEPFAALAACLKVAPAHLLYVGNSYAYDVLGAHRFGMRTAHFARRPARATVADLTFRDYRTLASWVLARAG